MFGWVRSLATIGRVVNIVLVFVHLVAGLVSNEGGGTDYPVVFIPGPGGSAIAEVDPGRAIDVGNQASEAVAEWLGWKELRGPGGCEEGPGGDSTCRSMHPGGSQFVTFRGLEPAVPYQLAWAFEFDRKDDSFSVLVNGLEIGTIDRQAKEARFGDRVQSVPTGHIVTVIVELHPQLVTSDSLTIEFRNWSRDGEGHASVYSLWLARAA